MIHRIDIATPVTLVGGFCCQLTDSERNQYHEFVCSNPIFKDYTQLLNRARSTPLTPAEIRIVEVNELLLYGIGKQWYADLISAETDREVSLSKLRESIGGALDQASMAWSETPTSTFDFNKCALLIEALMLEVKELLSIGAVKDETPNVESDWG